MKGMSSIKFNLKKYGAAAALVLVGVITMLGCSVYERITEKKSGGEGGGAAAAPGIDKASHSSENIGFAEYARYEESRLEEILSEIENIGKVKAAVYVGATPEWVPVTDKESSSSKLEESDSTGGSRVSESLSEKNTTVSGSCEAYVSFPEIKGVLIFADGAERAGVREKIINAVAALYGIPVHCISVLS